MVRPLKQDREAITSTTVKVSAKTRRLLQELKQQGFASMDQMIRHYLPSNVAENRPVFHLAKEIYDLTKRDPHLNKMIKDTSKMLSKRK